MSSIVHVLSSFGVGGQERVALDLAAGQVARGHKVSVIGLAGGTPGALADEFAKCGITVENVARREGLDPTLVAKLVVRFRALGADVIHTHNPLPLIYGAPAARLIGAVAIHTKHGRNPGGGAHLFLRRQAGKLVHAFVCVSDVTAAQAREQKDCSPKKLHVIPNGIRLERFHPDAAARAQVRAELGIPDDAWVIGTVGRLDEFKNQGLLIRAIGHRLNNKLRLVIVGDGPTRETVAAEVAKIPEPTWAHLTGRRMDVERVMTAFDVFALSSKSEGLPLVVPEAMAVGLPVVVTAVGGLPEVVDEGQTGYLVDVAEAALGGALERLANDRPLAMAMGRRAREVALTRYSAERMLDAYLELYETAR